MVVQDGVRLIRHVMQYIMPKRVGQYREITNASMDESKRRIYFRAACCGCFCPEEWGAERGWGEVNGLGRGSLKGH